MAIVAMFVCQSTEHDTNNPEQGQVHLTAVTGENEKHKEFFAYTPYADLRMGILNPEAFKQIVPGKTYRMTLEESD